MSNGQGIIRDEKGQEQPADKVRARKAAKTEPGHMSSQTVIQEKPVGKDEG